MRPDISGYLPAPLFSALNRHFAAFILRISGSEEVELALAAALASRSSEQGHICLDLAQIAGVPLENPETGAAILEVPSFATWRSILENSPAVGRGGEFKPLILDAAGRLYLHRYWQAEAALAEDFLRRASAPCPLPPGEKIRDGIERLFGKPSADIGCDWQRVAALAALRSRLCVISGGPGTGKTTTVVRLLALLRENSALPGLRIALSAPTGKAASRLAGSIHASKAALNCSEAVRADIPDDVFTIHRLLEPDRAGGFRRSRQNPLPVDLVVVDEASMVDLSLMHALVQALPESARLILLGDRDQLASVEAGAVLGDICGEGERGYSTGFSALVEQITGEALPRTTSEPVSTLCDSVIVLRHTYRFGAESGIGRLAAALNRGDAEEALSLLRTSSLEDAGFMETSGLEEMSSLLRERIRSFWPGGFAGTPQQVLARLETFRILCALRRGPRGVETINRLVEQILAREGVISPHGQHYAGRPIMVTRNDYRLGLFNGDTGVVLPDPEADGALRAFFPSAQGGLKKFSPSRLPEHETVFAMTVHKSQGSEFDRVLLVLPDTASELLTRELLYTAVTRARRHVEILGPPDVLKAAVRRRIERTSGLRERARTQE